MDGDGTISTIDDLSDKKGKTKVIFDFILFLCLKHHLIEIGSKDVTIVVRRVWNCKCRYQVFRVRSSKLNNIQTF